MKITRPFWLKSAKGRYLMFVSSVAKVSEQAIMWYKRSIIAAPENYITFWTRRHEGLVYIGDFQVNQPAVHFPGFFAPQDERGILYIMAFPPSTQWEKTDYGGAWCPKTWNICIYKNTEYISIYKLYLFKYIHRSSVKPCRCTVLHYNTIYVYICTQVGIYSHQMYLSVATQIWWQRHLDPA